VLAFLLALGIFCYFWLVGAAIGFACMRRRWLLQTMLVAPSVGFGAIVAAAVLLNYIGLPIERFAIPLAVAFGIVAAVTLGILRPSLPWREYAPFACVLAVVFVSNGTPLLRFGFDWVSISNNDATTYSLDAYRLLHYSFWTIPPVSELLFDATPFSLLYYHLGQFRGGFYHGFDVILALTSRLAHLNVYQAYMPVMAAGLLALTSAGGVLLLYRGLHRTAPVVACFAIGMSSLTTLGYIYQLGPQEFALATFVSAVALLTNIRAYALSGWHIAAYAVLPALTITGMNMTYNAFHIIFPPALLAFVVLQVVRHQLRLSSVLRLFGLVTFFILAFTNLSIEAVRSSILFALAFRGGHLGIDSAFPFYLVPTGLANFWGLYPIAHAPIEPFVSGGIAVGGLLIFASVAATFWLAWRGLGSAAVTATIFCLLAIAAAEHGDFALFKLTMYIQPFLWATLTAACFILAPKLIRRSATARWRTVLAASAPIVLLTLLGLNAERLYISRSEDLPGSGDITFVTVQHASSSHLLVQLQRIRDQVRTSAVILDTDSPALGHYESFYLYGWPNFAPSVNSQKFVNVIRYIANNPALGPPHLSPGATRNIAYLVSFLPYGLFNLDPQRPTGKIDGFTWYRVFDKPPMVGRRTSLLETMPRQTVLNRTFARDRGDDVELVDTALLSNHLILMNGSLGAAQGAFDRNAELYSLNDDIFYQGRTFSAVGRYLLFYVINPTRRVRLVMDVTATINADGRNALPPAAAVGTRRLPFDALGRGSARLFSPPLKPSRLFGHSYLAVDMGNDGVTFPSHRTGLMRLYGLDQLDDPRRFVGFARNISAISDENYQHLKPPAIIEHFPLDLSNPNLEYSGIYEDGWLSESSYAVLKAPRRSHVEVAGTVPEIDDPGFHTEARVSVDGQEITREMLGVGAFTLSAGDVRAGRHRLSVQFSHREVLPHGDRRIVVALLSKYGFVAGRMETETRHAANTEARLGDIPVGPGLELGPEWGAAERYGGKLFRWCGGPVTLGVPPASRGVALELEPGPGVSRLPLHLQVTDTQGRSVASFTVPGYERLMIPLPMGHSTVLRLHADNGGSHIASDPRILDFRVFGVASI